MAANKNKEDQVIYKIIRKKFLKLQDISFKTEVTREEHNTMSDKRPTLKHILGTIQKPGDQEKILEVSREGGKQTNKPTKDQESERLKASQQ